MKCIKNSKTNELNRVTDSEAKQLVNTSDWQYITRKEWKEAGKPKDATGLKNKKGVVA